ncbi:MAG: helix-turn-helix domain-containing protein [Muribaculum sp.]|nr:helix-turn-helix domain-containing protein [Muribaculum sp.]
MNISMERFCSRLLPPTSRTILIGEDCLLTDMDENDCIPESHKELSHHSVVKMDFAVVILCNCGSLTMKLDLKEYSIHKNELMFILPDVICEMVDHSHDCRVTIIAFSHPETIRESSNGIAMIPRRYLYKNPLLALTDKQTNEFISVYSAMRDKLTDSTYNFKHEIFNAYLQVLYLDICNLMKPHVEDFKNNLQDRNKQICDAFMDELSQHGGMRRDIAFYADKLNLSPKYLSRVVYTVSGRYAKDWIKDYVILQAKSMLDSGQYTVQQVSDRLNFPNQSFFGTYFKNTVGCSPKSYMEK